MQSLVLVEEAELFQVLSPQSSFVLLLYGLAEA
jgi:hypothetical protein